MQGIEYLEQNKSKLMYRDLGTLLEGFGDVPRIPIYKLIVVRHIYDELLFFKLLKRKKKNVPKSLIPNVPIPT